MRQRLSAINKGRKISPELSAKLSELRKGVPKKEPHKQSISVAVTKYYQSKPPTIKLVNLEGIETTFPTKIGAIQFTVDEVTRIVRRYLLVRGDS
jgi:hypothetical protein